MAATFTFCEDNGAAAGNPAVGATRASGVSQVNWKNIDDINTSYATNPIQAGSNSYTKYQFGLFTGSFNQVANGLFAHTSGVLGTGLTLKGVVTTGYATPTITTNAALTGDLTSVIAITAGLPVLFGTVGPQTANSTTLTQAGYSQYLATQLQTTLSAEPGDTATVVLTLRYDEN